MKLYFGKGACSLAPHILLNEAGFKYETAQVDLATKTVDGKDYKQVNPKGYVPALQLDNGEILTEAAVILQYIADQKGDGSLFPKPGGMERYHAMEWLHFVSTELHKGLGTFFNPKVNEEYRASVIDRLNLRFEYIANHLKKNNFVLGDKFSLIDAYLFTVLRWTGFLKVDITKWPELLGFMERVKARPSVQAALKAEHLM